MSQKKDPNDYQYGKPCEDHLGNKFKTVKEMCEHYRIPDSTYQTRKRQGWELERILTTPPKNYFWHSPHRNNGMSLTKAEKKKYKNYKEVPDSRILPGYEGRYQMLEEEFRNNGIDEYTIEQFIRQEKKLEK